MPIRIVTDRTCDLPDSVVAEHGITVTPLCINLDGESCLGGADLNMATLANILNIKPLLKMNDGGATSEKIRSRKRAVARSVLPA